MFYAYFPQICITHVRYCADPAATMPADRVQGSEMPESAPVLPERLGNFETLWPLQN
jgi:hypothetical protein